MQCKPGLFIDTENEDTQKSLHFSHFPPFILSWKICLIWSVAAQKQEKTAFS